MTELDLDDVVATSPLARNQLAELRELIASMERHGQRLESLNAELRGRVAAVVRKCGELERHDEFHEAALAFAAAHVESDRIDAIDDCDDPDSSDARWTEACARYNETKAALVRAFRSLSAPEARAEGTSTTESPLTTAGKENN